MTKLERALDLASQGFYVFPLEPNGKQPGIKDWQRLATRSPSLITAWWGHRDLNIGIHCDGICVVDLDVKNGVNGLTSWANLGGKFGPPYVETPSGGVHIYFADLHYLATNTVGRLGEGIDTRAKGGYVVAPGSTIDGKSYTRVMSLVPLLPMPDFLRNWFSARKAEKTEHPAPTDFSSQWAIEYARREIERDWIPNRLATIGTRNDTAFGRACRLWALGVPKEMAVVLLTWFLEQGALPDEGARACAERFINQVYNDGSNQ